MSSVDPAVAPGKDPGAREKYLSEIQAILERASAPTKAVDHIWANVFLGNSAAARDVSLLRYLKVTHILNAAEEVENKVDKAVYDGLHMKYKGFKVLDDPYFDIGPFLEPAAHFINEGVTSHGKVLVFCPKGVSRAAAFALAYLMLYHKMSLKDAVYAVIGHRSINPNKGFLSHLYNLEQQLSQRRAKKHG